MARKLTQLRKIRRLRDMTQEELAKRSGLSLAAVHKAETGLHSPRLVTLEAFAQALDVDVRDLLPQYPPARVSRGDGDVSRGDGDVSREDGDISLMRELEPA